MPPSGGVGRRARKGRRTGRFPYGLARAMHLAMRANFRLNARNTSQEAIAMRNLGRGVIVGAATLLAAGGGGTRTRDTPPAAPAAGQPAAGASASASAPAGGAATGTGT